ncbi:ferritin-like domain-containing protein [Hymenobacter terricola]|uniref:ferritin-like domain-containing protein n=1 Tax=Hymenobacter terricola TaxID=2819236 RepID=UPI001B3053D4|nr:ferritin-like domain-containing protein [Hymenobacter terricola]
MTQQLSTFAAVPRLPRRSFLLYTGAAGGLWLTGCSSKKDDPVVPAPVVASFSPTSGAPGTTIVVTGSNFTGTTAVTVGGVTAFFNVGSGGTLNVVLPAGAATGPIAVTTPAGTASSSSPFTVLVPVANGITGFAPGSGPAGTLVTVMGNGFGGATAVAVGGVAAAFTVTNTTTLTLTVPATAASGPIAVTTPGGVLTSATAFTVTVTVVNVGTGDAGILNYAYALEQLEAAFYARVQATAASVFSATEAAYFAQLAAHEAIHRDFLRAVITRDAPASLIPVLTPDFSTIDFSSRAGILSAARTFEDLGVAAYNGVARFLRSAAYLVMAGQISSVEARHAALVRELTTPGSFAASDVVNPTTGLDNALMPADVAVLVNPFLAPGSKLDVSGIR